ncbi:MAG: Pr6Pr family membrane protein [Clostridia bacterium]|nr:Pr6Pr family membrane protein [Clostridia bacterium]
MKRKFFAKTVRILTPATAIFGVLLSLLCAVTEGYSHWSKRLLYFTAQSNLWIGGVFLFLLFLPRFRLSPYAVRRVYLWKYVFTVSITLTGLIFCFLLAPFSDESYTPWTVCNLLTHVVTPLLAILDYSLDRYPLKLKIAEIFLPVVPPLCYLLFAGVLGGLNADFGRGVTYPYFFLNFRSPARFFGFSRIRPFYLGSFYWIFLFLLLVLFLSYLYAKFRPHK